MDEDPHCWVGNGSSRVVDNCSCCLGYGIYNLVSRDSFVTRYGQRGTFSDVGRVLPGCRLLEDRLAFVEDL